jgi:DNA-binding NtrC family response regulator
MKRLFHMIHKVAHTDLTALIMGETGTGKELVANAIHLASSRSSRPFVVVDCGSIPESLADSILFGHEKGSFTGANERRLSPFVEADGGTVFLDEIGELPVELQPRLLRVLQERKVKPIGSNSYRSVDVRIIAATRRELLREINGGSFRSDLYFRLAQAILTVPSLRERGNEDIALLMKHFAREAGHLDRFQRISADSYTRLLNHDWPGNVRELQNVTARLLGLAEPTGPIELDTHFSTAIEAAHETQPYDVAKLTFDKSYWKGLLRASSGNIAKMARLSGRSRPTVRAELDKLGLEKGNLSDDD